MDYSCLTEMRTVPDISAPGVLGQPSTAPGLVSRGPTHAVRVSDGKIVCPYTQQPGDMAAADQDWMRLHPAERCTRCGDQLGVPGWLT